MNVRLITLEYEYLVPVTLDVEECLGYLSVAIATAITTL
jgi:hypothetical protein